MGETSENIIKSVVLFGQEYEIVDEQSRNDIEKLKNTQQETPTVKIDSLGIPVYTKEKLDEDIANGIDIQEKDVILIDSVNSIDRTPSSVTYQMSNNDTYLDILFSTIRALQDEVKKLKNSFNYGIESYNGKQTATSTVVSEYEEESEPLWAVDENGLSEIEDDKFTLPLNSDHTLVPRTSVDIHDDFLKILENNDAKWEISSEELNTYTPKDNKIFLYLTTNNLNFDIKLKDIDSENKYLTLNCSNLAPGQANSKFNIMVCINKTIEVGKDDNITQLEGKNFVYISIEDYINDGIEYRGYYKNYSLHPGVQYLDNRYIFNEITFKGPISIYKFNLYSRKDNFLGTTGQPIEDTPSRDKYKYKAAHITVRVIDTWEEALEIKSQLIEGEPMYIKDKGGLYILIDGNIKTIGSSTSSGDNEQNNPNTGMNQQEIIELLRKNGIINIDANGTTPVSFNDIADITFINQNTGKRFRFEVNNDGELHSTELTENDFYKRLFKEEQDSNGNITLIDRLGINSNEIKNIRGFIGSLGNMEHPDASISGTANYMGDLGLYSDRLKIGAIYAPNQYQKVFGCSHAYIELENTSNEPINLDDFYIHYARKINGEEIILSSLQLNGHIPGGGTYLIRGKQYSDFKQPNTYIKVDTYDIEWYDTNTNELIDLTWYEGKQHTYLLTYGLPENFSVNTIMYSVLTIDGAKYRGYHGRFVDAISINQPVTIKSSLEQGSEISPWYGKTEWVKFEPPKKNEKYVDVIFKNTFMLDPAKQAYQGLSAKLNSKNKGDKMYDSSRARNNTATDYQYLVLDNDMISFPKSDEKYDITKFTPKASFEHKNVCTDKTQLNTEKPNAVTVAFGINMNTTRCFNWVSGGYFNEFIWIRKQGTTDWKQFESYHDSVTGLSENQEYSQDSEYPRRKKFGYFENKTTKTWDSVESVVYDRMTNVFPGSKTVYTAHKCVIDVVESPVSTKEVWEYVVGRENPDHTPDKNHTSNIQTFTLYPTSCTPRIFQTTDQQGFHWIEYQHWAAAANEINKTINERLNNTNPDEQIVPVLINTGDMTQNGSRANEWLDYYNAGISLFNHLEQMNVVGNNDLCSSTDVTELGTGDDGNGKTNAYYFHVFYCYEIDPDIMPIISNTNATKYIPSFYYFGNGKYSFVMINSEINAGNCQNWFKQIKNERIVNIYTGYTLTTKNDPVNVYYDDSFKTVYTMIYDIFNQKIPNISKCIVACHEMPFTVITNDNLIYNDQKKLEAVNRSLSGSNTGSLVGSHMNVMSNLDKKSNYWFSRLIEHFGVKLVIGGHKHTYACTNPLRELYSYEEDGVTKFSIDKKMSMPRTLKTDTVNFDLYYKNGELYDTAVEGSTQIHSSKFPIMKLPETPGITPGINKGVNIWYPYFGVDNELTDGVIYCMCQATGYKLKSNKELPSINQRFAYIIPETDIDKGKPANNQLYSMFTEIEMDETNNKFNIYLYRILNITLNTPGGEESGGVTAKEFTQLAYQTKACSYEYLTHESHKNKDKIFGTWKTTRTPMIKV